MKKHKKQCVDCMNTEQEEYTEKGFCEYCGDLCDDCIDDHEEYCCEHKRGQMDMIAMREDRDAR